MQYIWKTQSFDRSHLTTVAGEAVTILNSGNLNGDSGPDFSSSRVVINDVEWVGDVEIHLKTSAWNLHKHHQDLSYNKVVLHVVWQHDINIHREDGTEIPTLELKAIVDNKLLKKHRRMMESMNSIVCEPFFAKVAEVNKFATFDKVLVDRLQRKSKNILLDLDLLKGDWEQVTILLLFEYFGFKKNNDAFRQLADITEYRIINKLSSLEEIEAYLFGMAGFLNSTHKGNDYVKKLKNTFLWLTKKFSISQSPMSLTWWKFMRLRPANFPTLRIAQLAALLFTRKHLFKSLIEVSTKEAANFFVVQPSGFWRTHYHFHKEAKSELKGIGKQSARILSINVAAVLLVSYGIYVNDEQYKERAIRFLEVQKPEDNTITRRWKLLGIKLASAAQSQGAIELFNNYCQKRRCLECSIGHQILRS